MNCLIVDDNPIARTTLAQLTTHIKNLEVAGLCADAFEAYATLKEKAIDLMLLDIEMKGMTGIELAKNLGNQAPVIIFITSKTEYAVEAFELKVADYIVKPVMPARFIQAIERAQEILASKDEKVEIQDDEFIFIRDSNIIKRVKFEDILFAEAMGDYVKLHTSKKFYAVHKGLKDVELRLPPAKFIRVHRSYIVAVEKIDTIEQGALIVEGKPVPVADAYRGSLNKRLNIL